MFSDDIVPVAAEVEVTNLLPWRVLVVDDERDVHLVTKMVLSDFVYQDRKIELVSAYDSEQAKHILATQPSFAVALIDVVMENDSAGLQLVEWIRNTLKNKHIRLILRTGQPGIAPEDEVIRHYEINDYKAKSELSAQKLNTTMFASLRAYRDILIIERTRQGLEIMLDASTEFFDHYSIEKYTHGLMTQLMALLQLDFNDARHQDDGIILFSPPNYKVYSSCGIFSGIDSTRLNSTEQEMLSLAEKEQGQNWQECWIKHSNTNTFMYRLETMKEPLAIFIRTKKPFEEVDRQLLQIYLKKTASALENLILQDKHRRSQDVTIRSLAKLAEYRDSDTGEHLDRVEHLCSTLTQRLFDLKLYPETIDYAFVSMIGPASVLHDIGKVGIPDAILLKQGKLLDEEWIMMQNHVTLGSDVLSNAIEVSQHDNPFLVMADRIARCHHENWNGEGYPKGLVKDEIPLEARIMSIVDVYDALTSERPYKKAWAVDNALTWINEQSGIKFDPELTKVFVEMMKA
jgi:response regulator RpfG family c-di-GMP phosphodiesterase